jgi:hypothetical protein
LIGAGELAWTPPPHFDDLEILRPLGAGGMGSVFLAREAHLDRLVAVKFVAADTRDPHGVARFHVEARALARLQHPNVVAVYRLGEVDGRPYLAYEYVDGQRVDRLRLPLAWPEVLAIILGVARGLAAAHAAGVLHRDLKPANLMRGPGGEVKILDFGLARIFDPAAGMLPAEEHDPFVLPPLANTSATWDASSISSGRLTSHGSLVGTPLYLAPELWEGAAPTPRVDLYALGLIAYELLLGYHPRERLGGLELAQQVRDHDLPRLSEEVPGAPRPLTELIDRLVARDPAARPLSAQVVRDELEVLRALYRPLVAGEFAGAAVVVGDSFERIGQHTLAMVEDFYRRWFVIDPGVVPLFRDAPATQPRMLAVALKLAVEHLRDPVALVAFLEDLGRRHPRQGRAGHALHVDGRGADRDAGRGRSGVERGDAPRLGHRVERRGPGDPAGGGDRGRERAQPRRSLALGATAGGAADPLAGDARRRRRVARGGRGPDRRDRAGRLV